MRKSREIINLTTFDRSKPIFRFQAIPRYAAGIVPNRKSDCPLLRPEVHCSRRRRGTESSLGHPNFIVTLPLLPEFRGRGIAASKSSCRAALRLAQPTAPTRAFRGFRVSPRGREELSPKTDGIFADTPDKNRWDAFRRYALQCVAVDCRLFGATPWGIGESGNEGNQKIDAATFDDLLAEIYNRHSPGRSSSWSRSRGRSPKTLTRAYERLLPFNLPRGLPHRIAHVG